MNRPKLLDYPTDDLFCDAMVEYADSLEREVAELREALREAANHAANLGIPEAMLDRWDALISPPAQGGSE